jgi:hypothetical protein
VTAAGVRFGCVWADAGYGLCAPFRQGLTARNLAWAVDRRNDASGGWHVSGPSGVGVNIRLCGRPGCYAFYFTVRASVGHWQGNKLRRSRDDLIGVG